MRLPNRILCKPVYRRDRCGTAKWRTINSWSHLLYQVPRSDSSATDAGVVVASAKLESGFWRSDNASLRALPCPSRDSCNSSAVSGTGGCALGHEGPFCSLCSKDFSRFSEAAACQPCPSGEDKGGAVAALIGIIAGGLAAVVLYALFNHMIPKGSVETVSQRYAILGYCHEFQHGEAAQDR